MNNNRYLKKYKSLNKDTMKNFILCLTSIE